MKLTSLLASACLVLSACSTPYSPPVVVKGSPDFVGLADQMSPEQPLDVVLVHGMCTHDETWAEAAMRQLAKAIDANATLGARGNKVPDLAELRAQPAVRVVKADAHVGSSTIRMSAIIWSPLTASLKA